MNSDPVSKSYTDAELAKKLNLAGGTLTGALVLNGAPTIDLHASTKKYVDDGLNTKLNLSGGTLTGYLKIHADPAGLTDAVSKGYLDNRLTGISDYTAAMLNQKLDKVGGTLTGFLTLHADPVNLLHTATKQYVDNSVTTHTNDNTIHVTSGQKTWLSAITASAVEVNYLGGLASSVQTQLNNKLSLAGGTLTGVLVLNGAPTLDLHASTKKYVDDGLATKLSLSGGTLTGYLKIHANPAAAADAVSKGYLDDRLNGQLDVYSSYLLPKLDKSGGTMTGYLVLHADPTLALHPATKQYTDTVLSTHAANAALHLTSTQNTWLDAVTATATEVNYLAGVTSAVQTQLNNKLPLSGGSLTSFLTLHADPVNLLHAVTKQYVDASVSTHTTDNTIHVTSGQKTWLGSITSSAAEVNFLGGVSSSVQTQLNNKLSLAGGTLTGALILNAAPTIDLHASTKKYVDDGLALKLSLSGGVMTGYLKLAGNPVVSADAVSKGYLDDRLNGQIDVYSSFLNSKLDKSGGTMTGYIVLHADPTSAFHSTTKQYVDNSVTTLSNATSISVGALQTRATNLETTVGVLNTDPVTKTYTDTQLNTKLNLSGGTMTGYIALHADPVSSMQPTTKQYVDNYVLGLKTKESVRLATTANLSATYSNGSSGVNATLTGTANGALSVDGKTVSLNDRILVRLQTASLQNGDYTTIQVGNAGAPFILRRTSTMDELVEISGAYFNVFDGNTLKGTGWVLTVTDPTTFVIGTDAVTVNQFFGPGAYIGGDGLLLSGNTFSIGTASSSRIVVNSDNIDLATTGVTAGTYRSVTVDAYGRTTGGTNPTTLSGYGITDAPTLTGTGASGTWLINITGNSGTTDFVKIADTRSTNPTPQSYGAGIKFDFKQNSVDGLSDSGTYHGVMTIRQYASGSDWSGGGVRQLGFTDNHNLWIRGANADTTWSAWLRFLKTSDAVATNTANMVVARDASGNFAAGTITANLTGTASTASVAVTPTLAGYLGDYTLSDYNSGVAGGLTARYGSSTGLNKPTGTDHSVLTLAFSTIWATQMAGDWRTNQYYMRALTNGVWTSWVRLLKADETDSANTVDKIVRRDASGNFATNVITATTVKTSQIESTAIVTVLNAGVAQGMKLGSLVVSSSYSDTAPTYGAYIKGQIQSGVATGTAPLVIASTTLNTNLNADLLDGLHASTANTPSTVVSRDATGNFSANVITASLATYFLSTSTMNLTSGTSGIYRNENGLGGNYAYAPVIHIAAGDTMWQATVSYNANPGDGTMKFRQGFNGNWGNWLTVLSSANYNNYSPTLTGTGASGTWGIGVSGNAGTATVLQNARNFNITGDISAPAVSFNGSGNVTLVATLPPSGVEGGLYSKVFVNNKGIVTAGDNPTTLAGYGITDAPTLTGTGATGTWGISVSGNAGTATILQNARTINGVSFNGSANINILTTYDSNYSRINQPGGGVYTGQDVTKTGAIAIRLPTAVYTNSLMLKFEVEIYDFANGKSFTIVIAGYQSGGSTWSNVSAYSSTDGFTDRRFNVRFGKDTTAGRFVVYIGELASTWAYPQIFVKNVVCGYSSDPSITTGWTVDFEATAFANVGITLYTTGGYSATSSVANSLVYRDASGNFAANIITASLVGNASTAVALYNPRTINGVSFNGTANINLPGYDNTYRRLMRPEGASFEGNGSQTGAIAIRLPFGWTNTMIRMTIRVYNYAASGSCDIHLGGYTYVGLYWVNTYVNISSNPGSDVRYRVRFGYTAGGKCVIYIAEESSVWSYLKVEVVDVYIGHSNNTVAWETGWSVYLESAAAETVSMAWNADTTCSTYATYANTANALVKRDASGWIDVAAVKTAQIRNDSYIGLYTTSGAAQAIKVSSLVVSNNYADGAPTNGAYVKGQIASGVTTGTAPFTIASTTVSANLNADLLDGYHANTTNAANTVVARDGSGNFAANAITLAGDPTTALQAATKQYIDNKLPYCKGLNEASGDVDPNTTALHVILSNHANTPGLSSYWHITTTFYESISSTANRGQIAVQYNNGGAAYVRSHYAGAWTSWVRMDNSITTPVSATSGGTLVSAINSASLQVMGDATNGAFMSFNRLGVYALNMGIDIDNVFKIGGWSAAGGTPMSLTGTGNLQAKLSVTLPAEYSIGNITGATTINFANGQKARATLTGNVTFTFSFPGVGMYLLVLVQDATGNRTVTYPGGTKYVGSATAPAINTTASSETMLNVYWSGTAVYVGGSKVNA
ncbi:hypothetical protein [Flavobacterium sp.]|uniref:hypothetical protein n=1 Tax=Flavobacterium sp. TaxID=239 RepID=UPI0037BF2C92